MTTVESVGGRRWKVYNVGVVEHAKRVHRLVLGEED
jgi:hypothetical protein